MAITQRPWLRGHESSHVALVTRAAGVYGSGATIDAIVVPTARPAGYIGPVADLARTVGCLLVVICSAEAKGQVVAGLVASRPGLRAAVIDLPPSYEHPLLEFATSRHPHAGLPAHVDLSTKRNIGLLLARLRGWQQVLFVDDDIRELHQGMLARASSLLGRYRAVGFQVNGYPDNSVVCHAHRLGGGNQDTFIGGSALLVDTTRVDSFFPAVYNEDWLFLYDQLSSWAVASAGTTTQLEYDPFASPLRATSEEFGDVVAETLFWLLHRHVDVRSSELPLWRQGLAQRSAFMEDVTARLIAMSSGLRDVDGPLAAIEAAHERLQQLTPEDCHSFVKAWRADLKTWSHRLNRLPSFRSERRALDHLDLPTINLEVTR